MRRFLVILTACFLSVGASANAVELVMVEEDGCFWCAEWDSEIALIYPKTGEGKFAPLRRIDIHDPVPDDLTFRNQPVFTPTFILVQDGHELGRIEGYPGEDFFWGLLERMLLDHTTFVRPTS